MYSLFSSFSLFALKIYYTPVPSRFYGCTIGKSILSPPSLAASDVTARKEKLSLTLHTGQ